MNENLILNSAAARQRIKELLGIETEVELKYLCKPAGKTPQECSIVGRYERFCQPVWKFEQNGEKRYLNVIGADLNEDKHYFLEENDVCSGYAFQKGDVKIAAVRGWKDGSFGVFLKEGEIRNAVQHVYRP